MAFLAFSLTHMGKGAPEQSLSAFYTESLSIPVLVSLSAISLIRIITCFIGVSVVFYYALYISAKRAACAYVFLINKCLAFELQISYVRWQKFNMTGKFLLPIALEDSLKQVSHCNKFVPLCRAVCGQ